LPGLESRTSRPAASIVIASLATPGIFPGIAARLVCLR
jgi:hypothetical protein